MERLTVEQAYHQVEKLIRGIVYKFSRYRRYYQDDFMGEARLAFVRGYPHYDPAKAKLTTWTSHVVYRHLCSVVKHKLRKVEENEVCDNQLADNISHYKDFDPDKLELSEDAREIINLTIDPPNLKRGGHHGVPKTPESVKIWLYQTLYDLGWTAARIAESFKEIGEVIS